MQEQIYLNGEILPAEKAQLHVSDLGDKLSSHEAPRDSLFFM